MKDKIFEIIIGAFKRKLICSDMVEMDKIAGGINEATKAHYLPIIEKIKTMLAMMCFCKSKTCNRCGFTEDMKERCKNEDIRSEIFNYLTELAALKDKLKDK